MNILYGSDIHLEITKRFIPSSSLVDAADIVILAGDIHNHTHGIVWARETFKHKIILYVAGNHEYDGAHMGGLLSQMRIAAQEQNVKFLEGNSFKFRNKTFYGTTLWTDYMLFGEQNFQTCMFEQNLIIPQFMNAYKAGGKQAKAIDLLKLHRRARMFLLNNLELQNKQHNIVISHTAPSAMSITDEYKRAYTSSAFVSNLDDLLSKTAYWFHGHLHTQTQYESHGCQILSNCICRESDDVIDMKLISIPD